MKYKSKYTDRLISAVNKVAEQVCENLAAKNHEELPKQFWNTSNFWKREFKRQLNMARNLASLYGEDVIVHMMSLSGSKKIISLYAEFSYMPFLRKAQDEINSKKTKISKLINNPTPTITEVENPRPVFKSNKNSTLSRLREIDGEEEK